MIHSDYVQISKQLCEGQSPVLPTLQGSDLPEVRDGKGGPTSLDLTPEPAFSANLNCLPQYNSTYFVFYKAVWGQTANDLQINLWPLWVVEVSVGLRKGKVSDSTCSERENKTANPTELGYLSTLLPSGHGAIRKKEKHFPRKSLAVLSNRCCAPRCDRQPFWPQQRQQSFLSAFSFVCLCFPLTSWILWRTE